ncbi:MAG TPA: hypothetical protein VD813_01175, partial [Pseudonocardia sp.]|nr:hypothetical protein [Pseudonocardia sp.]
PPEGLGGYPVSGWDAGAGSDARSKGGGVRSRSHTPATFECDYTAVGLGSRDAATRSAREGCADQVEYKARHRTMRVYSDLQRQDATDIKAEFSCGPFDIRVDWSKLPLVELYSARAYGSAPCTIVADYTTKG